MLLHFPLGFPDQLSIEQEAERKVGWLLKTIFFATAAAAGYQFFPYMGISH